jgi:hypothetical protein
LVFIFIGVDDVVSFLGPAVLRQSRTTANHQRAARRCM